MIMPTIQENALSYLQGKMQEILTSFDNEITFSVDFCGLPACKMEVAYLCQRLRVMLQNL
jgi:hypothetical protein